MGVSVLSSGVTARTFEWTNIGWKEQVAITRPVQPDGVYGRLSELEVKVAELSRALGQNGQPPTPQPSVD